MENDSGDRDVEMTQTPLPMLPGMLVICWARLGRWAVGTKHQVTLDPQGADVPLAFAVPHPGTHSRSR